MVQLGSLWSKYHGYPENWSRNWVGSGPSTGYPVSGLKAGVKLMVPTLVMQ